MKLCVMNPVLAAYPFEQALRYLNEREVHCIEIGAGGYPGKAHLDAQVLLADAQAMADFKALLRKYDIEISAISCHGNPLHPNREIADSFHNDFINAILVAEQLGVDTIIGFSGCPGDCETAQNPNWVTCAWPEDYRKILDWQWEQKIVPYWKQTAAFAAQHGIRHIAFEMHPGFAVYNPETLLRLRAAVGEIIGANLDPSHLFWQGIDPVAAIRALRGAIYHFHAKDVRIDAANTAVNGVLDTKSLADVAGRSWVFRTVGYGHGRQVWNDIISALRTVGYDGAVSIEHEDALMSPEEGLNKAIAFLKQTLITEPVGDMWWV